jgi:glutamyl-tRNA reductase
MENVDKTIDQTEQPTSQTVKNEVKDDAKQETTTTNGRTYTQQDLDNITKSVREIAQKELTEKLNTIEKEFKEYKVNTSKKELTNLFTNTFGGNKQAVESLLKAHPELLKTENAEVELRKLKGTENYWFNTNGEVQDKAQDYDFLKTKYKI